MVIRVADAVHNVKHKAIEEFLEFLDKLYSGHLPEDYQCILNKIAFVLSYENIEPINKLYSCLMS